MSIVGTKRRFVCVEDGVLHTTGSVECWQVIAAFYDRRTIAYVLNEELYT